MPRTVLLVDDAPEIRGLLRQAMTLHGGFDVVAEASDGLAAVEEAGRHQPDIIVLDLGLPHLAGHEVVVRVRAAAPLSYVVVFSGLDDAERLVEHSGVAAVVRKGGDIEYLLDLLDDLRAPSLDGASITLAAEPRQVAAGRAFIRDICASWGCPQLAEQAALVVSELVTNAIVHAHSACEVRASRTASTLRIEVLDGGGGDPNPRLPTLDAESGRGLLLVSALSAAWGVDAVDEGRKRVWAELLT